MALKKLTKNAAWMARNVPGNRTAVYPLLKVTRFRHVMVNDETDIVIEGLARSANSFFVDYFKRFNPDARIAHHLHISGQVLAGVERQLPVVVLIRDPLEALSSNWIVNRNLRLDLLLGSSIRFYRSIHPHLDDVIVAPFATTTEAPGRVIAAANARWGTEFRQGAAVSDDLRTQLFDQLASPDRVARNGKLILARPTAEKERFKREVRSEIAQHPRFPELVSWYERFQERTV